MALNNQQLAEQAFRKYYKKATAPPTRRRKSRKIKVVKYAPQQKVLNQAKSSIKKKATPAKKHTRKVSTTKKKRTRRLIWRPRT